MKRVTRRELAQGEKSVIMVLGSFLFEAFHRPLDLLLRFITEKKMKKIVIM